MQVLNDESLLVAGQAVSLRTLVADRLRQAIITGRFLPGSQLRERELCELTGVSRPSVREALRQLEAEGLISAAPNRGLIVSAPSEDEIQQIYALRRVLETFAAREFARLRRPRDLEALKSAAEALTEAEEGGGSPLDLLEVGTAMHAAIAYGSGNEPLVHALETLLNRIALIRFISLHDKDRHRPVLNELQSLTDAIVAGDEALAEKICYDHLIGVEEFALSVVRNGYCLPGQESLLDA